MVPISKVPAVNISNRGVIIAVAYKLLYNSADVPKLLTKVTVGFTSPNIEPASVKHTPIAVNDKSPADVVETPTLPSVIAVAVVVPISKVPGVNVSRRDPNLVFINDVLYNNEALPKLFIFVTVGIIFPVIVPTTDNATPVFVNANVPAVVVLTPVFPNVIAVALVSPISKVPAAGVSNRGA